MVNSIRMMVISSGRSELEEVVMIICTCISYQLGRFSLKSSCLLAFLRIVVELKWHVGLGDTLVHVT